MQTLRVKNSRILRTKNVKFSGYYFYLKTNIYGDFQICISVPLSRPYPFKNFKGCLPQNLLSPLLNTLSHIIQLEVAAKLITKEIKKFNPVINFRVSLKSSNWNSSLHMVGVSFTESSFIINRHI